MLLHRIGLLCPQSALTHHTTRCLAAMATKSKVYGVGKGRQPGLYFTWADAKAQVEGFSGAVHKSFNSTDEAIEWLARTGVAVRHSKTASATPAPAKSRVPPTTAPAGSRQQQQQQQQAQPGPGPSSTAVAPGPGAVGMGGHGQTPTMLQPKQRVAAPGSGLQIRTEGRGEAVTQQLLNINPAVLYRLVRGHVCGVQGKVVCMVFVHEGPHVLKSLPCYFQPGRLVLSAVACLAMSAAGV